jgi:hypothetical protein
MATGTSFTRKDAEAVPKGRREISRSGTLLRLVVCKPMFLSRDEIGGTRAKTIL